MNKSVFVILIVFVFGTVAVSGCVTQTTPEAFTVDIFLEDPVYNANVMVIGHVENKGAFLCPCFELTYSAKTIQVWYDLMADGDAEWSAVDVSGIENGDWVIVTGQLRDNDQFWLKSIQKTEPLIGGETDEHGCMLMAGYTWCEAKQKCLRTWEEPCEITSFDECIAAGPM